MLGGTEGTTPTVIEGKGKCQEHLRVEPNHGGVAELVYAEDLKSSGRVHTGSTPVSPTCCSESERDEER